MPTRAPITRTFLDLHLDVGREFRIPDEQRHHLVNVLRAGTGEVFEVVTADRRTFLAEITSETEAVVLEATSDTGSRDIELELYQAVPKGKRMDIVVEKVVEIGVTRIVPVISEHSVVRIEEGGKVDRWRRIAESAARQALRERVPEVASPVPFSEAIVGGGVLLHNGPGLPQLERIARSPERLFVGPEGGWSDAELDMATASGAEPAQLGGFRLRSETAGIVGVVRARVVLEALHGEDPHSARE